MVRPSLLALTLALLSVGAWAQARLSGSCAGCAKVTPGAPAGHSGFVGISGRPFGGRGFRRPFTGSYPTPWPYLYPGYYDYADYGDVYEPPPAPQAPPPAAPIAPQSKPEASAEPVLLELQGNQWVRVSSFKTTPAEPSVPSEQAQAKPMPPAVLVFRDGHREEVTSYSIIGPVIYTKGDYWATGSWTRSIQISDLNVAATLKANQERGVAFNLPSGPGEVVIRP